MASTTLAVLLILSGLQLSAAALNSYAYITGSSQGVIQGSVTVTGHQDGQNGAILVLGFNHSLSNTPSAAGAGAGGAGAGKVSFQSAPFTIIKQVDKATPLLYTALTTGEVLTSVVIRAYTAASGPGQGNGQDNQYYTITMANALITRISSTQFNTMDLTYAKYAIQEEVDLSYAKIQWTWMADNTTSAALSG